MYTNIITLYLYAETLSIEIMASYCSLYLMFFLDLFFFLTIIVLNSLRCLKREVQETRSPLSNDQVTEEDIKMFKHTQALTTKVKIIFV